MAGELIIEMLKNRGGKDSDYADVVYGEVTSDKPLKVQLSNNMVLTIILSFLVEILVNTRFRVRVKLVAKKLVLRT